MSFARKIGDKYGKKLIDTATGDLIGNKIADKTTSLKKSKIKEKEKKDETNELKEIYVPPEKR